MLRIIERKIKDPNVIWLIEVVLKNHRTEIPGRGMPIGNLTSQFFANVYLGELDLFVKHVLKAKYYLRYVDDFAILHRDKKTLERWKIQIDEFLKTNLRIGLHPEKTRIISLSNGVTLLGFRVFRHFRLLKKSNAHRIWKRLDKLKVRYDNNEINLEKARQSLEGWLAYARFANTYSLRNKISERFNELFSEVTRLR